MKGVKQVVWSEGMLLGQQHFQSWDEFIQARQDFFREAQAPLSWGVAALTVDEDALENGQFQLNDYSIVFADGTVAVHSSEYGPLRCRIQADARGHASVYVGVPANKAVAGIAGYRDATQLAGQLGQYQQVPDRYDHTRAREVLLARPHVHLLNDGDSRDAFVAFKVAELESQGDERFRLVPDYIPPLTAIRASPALTGLLDRLTEVIRAKVRALAERRRHRSESVAEFSNADVAHFWLLNSLNAAIPELNHLRHLPMHHPEQAYRVLARLAGALCTFSMEHEAEALPRYNHTDLGTVFGGLETALRALIDTVIPSTFATMPLTRESESLYVASQIDWHLLESASFYLGVRFEAPDASWVDQFPKVVKIGSRDTLEIIISSAMPGVQIRHTAHPPSQLPLRSRYEYFRIDSRGDYWDAVVRAGSLAVYVPQIFAGATLELISVQE
jgi:type VI secretion system protein ImpJ